MFLADASTKRPVAMASLLIALVLLGVNSYRKFSLESLPSVDAPYVTITTVWPGASPEDIEKDVAKRIEDGISGVEGLKHISSTCIENASNVMIEFEMGTDVDVAAQDVREKVDAVVAKLPSDAERPVISKLDVNATPIVTMFLSGDLSTQDLYWYADNRISDKFSSVDGVADVQTIGGSEREVWVELDRDALAAAGLTSAQVAGEIGKNIMTLPGGRVRDAGTEVSVRYDAECNAVEEISHLQVAGANGARRYISDLGKVRVASEEVRQKAFLDGRPGIAIKVVKKSDGNTVKTTELLRARFEQLKKELPPGVRLDWLQDDAEIVQANVDNTIDDIASSVLLCAVILFAFLLNLRTTFIVAVTMPLTIVISLFFMQLTGMTLNIATLLAIGLSGGILVSNSIVVLENIAAKFETIADPWEAARVGTGEVSVAVLASAGTNVVVMIPIAMMTSIVGKFFYPFAVTTLIVNFASIFISFTLTPMLCALVMKPVAQQTDRLSRAGRAWERKLGAWGGMYGDWLLRMSRKPLVPVAVILGFVALLVASFAFLGKGLGVTMLADDDWGRVQVRLEYPDYYSIDSTEKAIAKVAERLSKYDGVRTVLSVVGKADGMSGVATEGVYLGQIDMVFCPAVEREEPMASIAQRIRDDLANEPDAIVTVQMPGYVAGANSSLEFVFKGDDIDELTDRARKFERLVKQLPEIAQVDSAARDDKPELRITPDRAILSDLGVDSRTLGTMIRANIDGVEAGEFKNDLKTVDIRVKLEEREGAGQVSSFMLPAVAGRPIPLESIVDVERTGQKVMIYRRDKARSFCIHGNERKGYSSSAALSKMEDVAKTSGIVGDGYELLRAGSAEMLDETVADFLEAIILAVVMTFLTLSAILESFRKPFVALSTFPMCLIGVLLALKLSGMDVSIFVLLGVVLLIGVVVNAAVLIVDKQRQLEEAGENKREAMCHAVTSTFRAVLMVVVASGLGMLPIAMSTGIGSVNRVGIGAASFGGILVAGALTLLVLPFFAAFGRRR